jgi:hypothetical protein
MDLRKKVWLSLLQLKTNSMKKYSITVLLALLSIVVNAQDCELFFPFEKGKVWEMEEYNAKGKLQGKSRQEVVNNRTEGSSVVATIKMNHTDDKGKNEIANEYEVSCNGGVFKMAIAAMVPSESMEGFKTMDMTIDAKDLEMPTALEIGMSLPDGSLVIKGAMNGMTMMTMTVEITNRKVEGKESITTSAGTFECYKISESSTMKMGFMNKTSSSVQYFAPKYGVVRSEFFDKNGKLEGYSIMSQFN